MKLPIFVLAMLCLNFSAFSQFSLGVKGGISHVMTSSDTKDFVSLNPTTVNRMSVGAVSSQRTSLGLSLLDQNDIVFFMIDGLYTQTKENFRLVSDGLGRSTLDPANEFEYNTTNLRLIATGGARIKDFRLGFGPELSLILDHSETLSSLEGFEAVDQKLMGGFNFLLGYTFLDRIQVDLKYVKYFSGVGSAFKFEDVPLDFKSSASMIELTLGIYL